jgi:nucleotide-binding universal stress UspA family protein
MLLFYYICIYGSYLNQYINKGGSMKSLTERIITVGTFPYSRSLLLQIQLQTEGIDCFLVPKESLQPIRSADLRVKQADLAKALKIIDQSIKFAGSAKEKAVRNIGVVRRILVPVDFSSLSLHACRFAISLAQKYKAEVKLLHVFYNPAIDITPFDEHYSYQVKLSNNLREIEKNARVSMIRLEEKLNSWCENAEITEVKISTGFANGEAADEILAFSKKYRPAIIVMGTRGLTKGTHPLGRVTTKIVENAEVPVLALPDGSVLKISKLKNLIYATDFDPSDYSVINRLIHMLAPLDIRLHCVHVSVGYKKPWDPVKMDELKQHLTQEYADNRITFEVIVSDNIVYGIESYIRNNSIDAIAVINHKRGPLEKMFAPSLTKKIFSETGKPLFVFHAST